MICGFCGNVIENKRAAGLYIRLSRLTYIECPECGCALSMPDVRAMIVFQREQRSNGQNYIKDEKGKFAGSRPGSGSGGNAAYKISSCTVKIENDFSANRRIIDSDEYANKFNGIVMLPAVQERLVETARHSIYENDGTQDETITFLNKWTGKQVGEKYHHEYKGGLTAGGMITVPDAADNSLILVHNHGNSSPFSFDDFYLMNECPQIKTMIAAGHNGIVYRLSVGSGKRLDMSRKSVYNETERDFRFYYDKITGDLKALEKYCSDLGWRFEYE